MPPTPHRSNFGVAVDLSPAHMLKSPIAERAAHEAILPLSSPAKAATGHPGQTVMNELRERRGELKRRLAGIGAHLSANSETRYAGKTFSIAAA
jgi:hypothetical protein